ncbi:hypothetical protein BJX99DRAFT_41721 [Aspergillus californicus]
MRARPADVNGPIMLNLSAAQQQIVRLGLPDLLRLTGRDEDGWRVFLDCDYGSPAMEQIASWLTHLVYYGSISLVLVFLTNLM